MNQPQSDRERLNYLVAYSRQYEAQAQEVQMQLGLLEQSIRATQITLETIENFKDLQDNQEILLPLGNLVFVKAKLADSSNVLVDIGASVVLEKSVDKAVESLTQRMEELTQRQMQLKQGLQQLVQQMEQLRAEIENLVRKMQQPQQPMMGS